MAVLHTSIPVTSSGLTTSVTGYTSGDVLGTVFTFANAVQANGGLGFLYGATIVDKADIIAACQLYLFNASPSVTDNAAFAPSDAEALTIIRIVNLPPPDDVGGVRVADIDLQKSYKAAGGTTSIYGVLVTRSAHTFFGAATDIIVTLDVIED